MGKKNVRNSGNNNRYQIEDDFEDFGYDIKNIKRSSKKKVENLNGNRTTMMTVIELSTMC